MASANSSVFLLITSIILISSTNAVNPPGNYTLPIASSTLCFAARFDLTFNIEYLKLDGKTNISRIPLNNETFQYYTGDCSKANSHQLTIGMLDNLTSITFYFDLNEKNQTSLKQVSVSLTIKNNDYFPNCSDNVGGSYVFLANESLFITDLSNSYRCYSKIKIDNFQSKGNVTIKSVDIENLRIQPFVDEKITFNDYAKEKVCTMDTFKSSTLIPIIVGACLAVLVVVVLAVYLVRRRRYRNGYQSV
ncbi:unnamed protein product [Rotaria magnacalcarata]|uniref:Lysosome-associated membrane glycoprotein 5 n=1 Tax=Rotaria magnacalcarata TaxID=392030 RepID=A0A816KX47_9BILA|nr:unnamed protein product [Rotaria magnacalcarata]CAF1459385.1 unnamed protein product [Rotaria magnacalcarata]CAF1921576.1 unnamed protein product [Rotaria magnacalcarata]CAF3932627.1 unnamed protein product [Rotaria magnacalcarata]CAF3970422.1 unnamed protein product [Rotaria magnacalcarata]